MRSPIGGARGSAFSPVPLGGEDLTLYSILRSMEYLRQPDSDSWPERAPHLMGHPALEARCCRFRARGHTQRGLLVRLWCPGHRSPPNRAMIVGCGLLVGGG